MGDVTMTVTVAGPEAARIMAAMTGQKGYVPASTEDAMDFVRREVMAWLAQRTLDWEIQQSINSALNDQSDPLVNVVSQT